MTTIMRGPLRQIRRLRTATLLTNSCAIRAITTIPDAQQGAQRAWPAVTQTVACAHMSKGAAIAAGTYIDETSAAIDKLILLPWDTAINPGDRIEIDGDGVQWSVEGNIAPPGTYDVGLAVPVVRVPR